jgi:hypothetical protein
MAVTISGRTFQSTSLGFILVLLVLIACFVLWLVGKGNNNIELALIAALAVAYLIG